MDASVRSRVAALAALAMAGAACGHARADPAPDAGRFLVANASMADPRFAHGVVLLLAHGHDGTLGLIVNRPTTHPLAQALPPPVPAPDPAAVLWFGGPVQPAVASVLFDADEAPAGARSVFGSLYYGAGSELLAALATRPAPRRIRVYAGYAGWSPGQLDDEIRRGAWRVRAASIDEVFSDDGEALWRRLVRPEGTWVRDGAPARPRSAVLARDLDPEQVAVRVHAHRHRHRPAAHGAVLDVLRRAGGAVHRELQCLPAPRAGGRCRVEHLSG